MYILFKYLFLDFYYLTLRLCVDNLNIYFMILLYYT